MSHLYLRNSIEMENHLPFLGERAASARKGNLEGVHSINIVRVSRAGRMQEFFSSFSGAKKTVESVKLFLACLGHFFAVAAVAGGVVILKTFLKVAAIPELLHNFFKLCLQVKNQETSKAIKTTNLIAKNIFSSLLLGEEAGMYVVPTWILPFSTFLSFSLVGFSALALKESVEKIQTSKNQVAQFAKTLRWNSSEIEAKRDNFVQWVDAKEKTLEAKQEIWQQKIKIINAITWIVLGSLKLVAIFTCFVMPMTPLLLLTAIAIGSSISSIFIEKASYKNFKKEQLGNTKVGPEETLKILNAYRPTACL